MISSLQVDMIQNKCIWWLTGLIKWALCIRSKHREKMPLSRPMHGSELKLVASGRILLTNGLVSVRTLVLSLLRLFVSSALFSTWWMLTADYPSCFHVFSWFYCYISTLSSSSDYVVLPPHLVGLVALFSCVSPRIGLPILVLTFGMVSASALGYLYCVLVTMYMVLDLAFDLLSAWPLTCSFWRSFGLSVAACPWIFLCFFAPNGVNGLGFGSMTRT